MRRTFATVVVALSLVLSVLVAATASADAVPDPTPAVDPARVVADDALAVATEVLDGGPAPAAGADVSPTLALRDVFLALPSLDGPERKQALGLLARPTQGANDPYGDGYTAPSRKDCGRRICVHWVSRTDDAPPGRAWVRKTMKVVKRTWAAEVGRLGYRSPLTDGNRGGDDKFDVYLKDVGAKGYYGYCVPERELRGWQWRASGYCVLDDDFARSQFGARPMASLRVTAAHEFFHAVQFGYDYAEDRWLMEASATWMEERVADDVDDNRQYLRFGQVREPGQPLDLYDPAGFDQYANWAFFEYLSTRFGVRVVRDVWELAADRKESRKDPYSTLAVRRALPSGTTFPEVFRAYAAANTVPGRSYPEGRTWPSATMSARHTLTAEAPAAGGRLRIDHMAARHVEVTPGDTLRSRAWRLRVVVDGPAGRTAPAAFLVVHRGGGRLARLPVRLDADGAGRRVVKFSARSVGRATLTLANASTRFRCWQQQETYSCQGTPRDDDRRFSYRLRVFRD